MKMISNPKHIKELHVEALWLTPDDDLSLIVNRTNDVNLWFDFSCKVTIEVNTMYNDIVIIVRTIMKTPKVNLNTWLCIYVAD